MILDNSLCGTSCFAQNVTFLGLLNGIKIWSDNISLLTKRDANVGSDYDPVNDDCYGYVD